MRDTVQFNDEEINITVYTISLNGRTNESASTCTVRKDTIFIIFYVGLLLRVPV